MGWVKAIIVIIAYFYVTKHTTTHYHSLTFTRSLRRRRALFFWTDGHTDRQTYTEGKILFYILHPSLAEGGTNGGYVVIL